MKVVYCYLRCVLELSHSHPPNFTRVQRNECGSLWQLVQAAARKAGIEDRLDWDGFEEFRLDIQEEDQKNTPIKFIDLVHLIYECAPLNVTRMDTLRDNWHQIKTKSTNRVYRDVSKAVHPDHYPAGSSAKFNCEQVMKLLNSAYAAKRDE